MDADVVMLENASQIHVQRLNAREVLMLKSGKDLVFLAVDGSVKLAGRDQVFRTSTLRQEHPAREKKHKDVFSGRVVRVTQKPETISGISGNHFYRPERKIIPCSTQVH